MKRREFLQFAASSGALFLGGCAALREHELCLSCLFGENPEKPASGEKPQKLEASSTELRQSEDLATSTDLSPQDKIRLSNELLQDERAKSVYFQQDFPDDIYFRDEKLAQLESLLKKFRRVQSHVGYGHFNLVGMNEFFRLAERASDVGALSSVEKKFLEELFYFEASKYGFKGAKVFKNFTHDLNKSEVVKLAGTGHYLMKGESLETYNRIRKDVGPSLILTSGVRGTAKQFHLFFEKVLQSKGNASKASRSLAPPGYSFHGGRDFDVGKVGYGFKNFTQEFATTAEYKSLLGLEYFNIRYTQRNLLGVRFEPWHVRVDI